MAFAQIVSRYASLVKFSHTLFALPFALIGYTYALCFTDATFSVLLLIKVLAAMVLARNTAMGFNRYADRKIDALNPRTRTREIPSGVITPQRALLFVMVNAVGFMLVALWINLLAFILSPVALIVLLGYSLTKRFTAWCHVVLGLALGIAPVGAYIAVTGGIALFPVLLTGLVLTWCSGFDIIYALQDIAFDRSQALHSVPARFGVRGGLVVSMLLHLLTLYAVVVAGLYYGGGVLYWIGAAIFIGLLIFQHVIVTPHNLSKIGLAFGTTNGVASVMYALFTILDMGLR
ncbi:MAG: putative 4-hydroxybenzoate polyprenyltransferase [Alistipes sp.]|nr:putative 4-hydroxybenzoate polyprenyltransferase [Alistipes sp.]